jgi:hypothetical protein
LAAKGIQFKSLVSYKKGNLGAFVLAIFYLVFPWLTMGAMDYYITIFGLMFLTISVMRAKESNTVIGGLAQAFIGVIYIFALAGTIGVDTLWMLTLVLTGLFFIMEMGFVKFGPTTQKADAFQMVPFVLMTFTLLMALLGYTTLFVVDWSNMLVALNYVAIFLFCALSALQLAGWNVAGKKTNMWLVIFAVGSIVAAFMGVYQGTLFQWR